MSNAEVLEVWGINVPISPKGRRKWPDTIREMAIKRVLDGAKIGDVAKETGANKSLVAKWVKDSAEPKSAPGFVELVKQNADQNARCSPTQFFEHLTCQIQLGDTSISVQSGYPAKHLGPVAV